MSIAERRKRPRSTSPLADSVFAELRHTFGPVRKSVYKVLELDEFGFSFVMPVAEGYFAPDTPLQYTLVNADMSRTDGAGFVRYYQPYTDQNGGLHYKIGVENNARWRDTPGGRYVVRPYRHVLEGKQYDRALVVESGPEDQTYELIDISRYSAAFGVASEDSSRFRLSQVLSPVKVVIDKVTVFDGSVTVSRMYDDAQGRRRVVVEPRGQLFDLGAIEEHETLSTARAELGAMGRTHDTFDAVEREFKAEVADLRCYLEDYRRLCESPRMLAGQEDQRTILEELAAPFNARVDRHVVRIDEIVRRCAPDEQGYSVYRAYFQKHLLSLLLASPVNHRAYFKPEGYAGDYETIRMIHLDPFSGPTLFAKLMNNYTVSVSAALVARTRTEYLSERLRKLVSESPKTPVEVLSIACGPAMEVDMLMKKYPQVADRISLTLLDQEIRALQFSQDNLYSNRITYGSTMPVAVIHSGIEGFLRRIAEEGVSKRYDFIYAFGLFDYFDRTVARFVVRRLSGLLAPGGRLFVSNVSTDRLQYRTYAEFCMEWYLVYRSREEMADLVPDGHHGEAFTVDEICGGIMKFLELQM